jgi:hypothetical protein
MHPKLQGAGESFPCRGVSTGAAPLKVLVFQRPCEDTIGSAKDSSPQLVAGPKILAGASGGKGACPLFPLESFNRCRSSRSRRQSRRFLQKIRALRSLTVSVGFAAASVDFCALIVALARWPGALPPFPPTPLRGFSVPQRLRERCLWCPLLCPRRGVEKQNLEGRCPSNSPAGE